MSGAPICAMAAAMAAATCFCSVTSAANTATCWSGVIRAAAIACLASSSRVRSLATIETWAPALASRTAVALPMPLEPPVMIACCPTKLATLWLPQPGQLFGDGRDRDANLLVAVRAGHEESQQGRVIVDSRRDDRHDTDAPAEKRRGQRNAPRPVAHDDGHDGGLATRGGVETVGASELVEEADAGVQPGHALGLGPHQPDGGQRGAGIGRRHPDAVHEAGCSVLEMLDDRAPPRDVSATAHEGLAERAHP